MSNPIWPATLPQKLPIGLLERSVDNRIRFTPDAGPGQIYTMGSANAVVIQVSAERNFYRTDQKATLEQFFEVTLAGGVLPFDWADPTPDLGTATFRFVTKPLFVAEFPSATEPGYGTPQQIYRCSFDIEQLPWYPPVETTIP